ncbi:MAG: serine hydrolase domain-containing protein [Acidimicrobiales bacterium]
MNPTLEQLVDAMFDEIGPLATTNALLIVYRGEVVAERYAGTLAHLDRPAEPIGAETLLLSWSMAKSMLHAVVGMLQADGVLDVAAPAPVPAWQADERRSITVEHLLEMRDGLAWAEDYVEAGRSDVIEMLFGSGSSDVAAYAESRKLAAVPGERFCYSSGTTNIVSAIVGRTIGGRDAVEAFLADRLFGPTAMTTARATFDAAGTWVASSYVHATTRDFARFGELYLHDGVAGGLRLLPEGWVDHGRRPLSVDPEDGKLYGAHWWVTGDEHGSFWAAGYEGQSILISPDLDLVVVRLGKTPAERGTHLFAWRAAVVGAVAVDATKGR